VRDQEDAAFDCWNEMAARVGLEPIQRRTADRRRLLTERMRDVGGIEGWRTAVAKVEASPFLRGEANGPNHPDWRADFDFIVTPKTFTRLIEGRYDARPAKTHKHGHGGGYVPPGVGG
jgi:hypothetical protein